MSVVRRAAAADAEACRAVVLAAYAVHLPRMTVRPQPMTLDYATVVADHETWLVDDDGEVVALLVLTAYDDHLGLDNVAVAPSHQGRGLGRELMAYAEGRAQELGLPRIRLHTHATMVENQRLYERLGYVETHRAQDGPWSRVFYEKDLSRS